MPSRDMGKLRCVCGAPHSSSERGPMRKEMGRHVEWQPKKP
jgi:hypothetical protein